VESLPEYALGIPGEQRDRLVAAVMSGAKTMTSGLLVHYEMDSELLPEPGQRFRLVDSSGPRAVVEVTEVQLMRLADVGPDVARGEGEGFRDVAHWRETHETFWAQWNQEVARHLGRDSWAVADDDIVVVETCHVGPLDGAA
jgi:uncharacterized protein YhfF